MRPNNEAKRGVETLRSDKQKMIDETMAFRRGLVDHDPDKEAQL